VEEAWEAMSEWQGNLVNVLSVILIDDVCDPQGYYQMVPIGYLKE
jgi:hypothetical protein